MNIGGIFILGFVALVAWASVIDFAEYRIPNILNLALLAVGIIYSTTIKDLQFWPVIIECLAVFIFFWFFSWSFKKFRGYSGLGFGDVKFISALTSWVGVANIPILIFIASFLGLVFVLVKNDKQSAIFSRKLPFAPFLSFSGCAVLFAVYYWDANLMELLLYQ